ncbi:MAG: CBS domain-containing protein [Candidatus Marsarchaeota archaeon]|jgi:CBS domain-containing protein|nr:CBS domain-containing protein [Candidatus Marsarchaeota archaeon]MCL5418939.1 CBS domain-containing protein [Candidatus Marsarchaeota archaeon]
MANIEKIPDELITKAASFDYNTPITEVIPSLGKYEAVIIKKDKSYYGIIDTRALYRGKPGLRVSKGEKAGKFAVRVPKISDSTSIDDVIYYFYRGRVKALPYIKGNSIKGVLGRKTMLKMLLSLGILKDMHVEEAMSTPVLALSYQASLAQAESAMRENKVNRLVVIGEDDSLQGIITHYDIIKNFTKTGERLPEMKTVSYSPSNVPIGSIMEKNPQTISAGSNVADAVRHFVEDNISSIIIVKGSKPIGVLTVTDVLEHIIATRRIEKKRIFISGLDSATYDYEDEIREGLNQFATKMEKLAGMRIDYITMRIKGKKGKLYELQARVSMGKRGIVSIDTTGYIFEKTFNDTLYKLEENVKKMKEKYLTLRKVNTLREAQ